ncbi:hypothetical protein GPECTOR_191g306 [Gonium pectorale]|uniref:phytol kinase n=1 Tax=Gonium pectorale TaxID=33097 RepID=A0A150FX23_GONPE|nr:hypothetical protein GPECTOR_191g306 [Gonium pectorale]|eukprot:KXZ42174.1 hypothetical protein GPECTOR_191g306 [Gonium pectorale]
MLGHQGWNLYLVELGRKVLADVEGHVPCELVRPALPAALEALAWSLAALVVEARSEWGGAKQQPSGSEPTCLGRTELLLEVAFALAVHERAGGAAVAAAAAADEAQPGGDEARPAEAEQLRGLAVRLLVGLGRAGARELSRAHEEAELDAAGAAAVAEAATAAATVAVAPPAMACGNPHCGNFSGESEAALKLQRCGSCRLVRYCGAGCQRAHWVVAALAGAERWGPVAVVAVADEWVQLDANAGLAAGEVVLEVEVELLALRKAS